MKLTAYERETIINYNMAEAEASVYTHDKKLIARLEQLAANQISRLADTGNLGGGAKQGIGHLAGDHVGFVTAGHSDQHVGIIGPGLAHHRR